MSEFISQNVSSKRKILDFPHCAKRYSVGGGLIKKAADAIVLVLKKQIAKKMSMEFIMRASRNCKRSFCGKCQ